MEKFLICFFFVSALLQGAPEAEAQHQQTDAFYVVNVESAHTEKEAISKTEALVKAGEKAAYLWIPDYASLGGARLYCVYIGPYSTQNVCETAVERLKKSYPAAYGLLVSQEVKRVQINGKGKVVIMYPRTSQQTGFVLRAKAADNSSQAKNTAAARPSTDISVFGKKGQVFIANVPGDAHLIDKANFTKLGIPADAVSACEAHGDGSDDYFYCINSDVGLMIFRGWFEAGQTGEGLHWEKIREILH
ncbi:MAG: hypothetical protein KGZ82_10505 [Bacteroidales bacterium]|nr:hypothetical protein [Bacteroidales bacterium]